MSRTFRPLMAVASLSALVVLAGCAPQGQAGTDANGNATTTGTTTRVSETPRSSGSATRAEGTSRFETPSNHGKVDLPAGTAVPVRLTETVSSETATDGQTVGAETASDVTADGRVVIRSGSRVKAHVSEAKSAKRFGGQASVTVAFDSVEDVDGGTVGLQGSMSDTGKKQVGKDAATIAGSAVGGAILGKVVGGSGKDAAVGAVVGGGIGTAVASRKGQEAILPSGEQASATTTSSESVAVND